MPEEILEPQETKEASTAFYKMRETLEQFFQGAAEYISEKIGYLNQSIKEFVHDLFYKMYELNPLGSQSLGSITPTTIVKTTLKKVKDKNLKKSRKIAVSP